jgi:ADP-ribosylglycohydrolase
MAELPLDPSGTDLPRPIPASYWVVPGRLLVGEYPGSVSRAAAMERLRAFLSAGVTCFIDLTESGELPSYERLLPFETPAGRRVEYLREPITDHAVPESRAVMSRILAMLDDALSAGHVVYLHCRGGVGRSAMAAGCWLAARGQDGERALEALQEFWQASRHSEIWPTVPETDEQRCYVRDWIGSGAGAATDADRCRGALLGLALGEAIALAGPPAAPGLPLAWGQHTALALCLAESLLERRRMDARDQMERYLRWSRAGHLAAGGQPPQPTPDIARALASYEWRGLPMAGSHDPQDRSTGSLSRVVAAALVARRDASRAVSLAAECSRTTHQSPVVLDACRYFAALLLGAIAGGEPQQVLAGRCEPAPGLWAAQPLRDELDELIGAHVAGGAKADPPAASPGVIEVLGAAIRAAGESRDFETVVSAAIAAGGEPALQAALAGSLAGALHGASAVPMQSFRRLQQRELLEEFAARLAGRQDPPAAPQAPRVTGA